MSMESKQIFISHAEADKEIADAICDLLATGMGINAEEMIFCSSLESLGIPSGSNFVEFIKRELQNTKLVILLLTQSYFASQFCMAELGASWIQSNQTIPLIVPPLKFSDMKAVLTGVQARVINESSAWNEIADEIRELFSLDFKSSRWERKREKFVNGLKSLLKEQKEPPIVALSKFKETEEKLEDASEEIEELEDKLQKKQSLIEELKTLKDKSEVNELEKTHMDELKQFEALCENARNELDSLPSVVKEAIYYYNKGGVLPIPEAFDNSQWAEIREAADLKMLHVLDDEPIELNDEHPKVYNAYNVISDLKEFMSEHEEAMQELIEDEYEVTFDLTDRGFWDQFIG